MYHRGKYEKKLVIKTFDRSKKEKSNYIKMHHL